MRALILNSGLGSRMGVLTTSQPKCMTSLGNTTILKRQLVLLEKVGVKEVIITTGYYDDVLVDYCKSLDLNLNIVFVKNEEFESTNYIYSIYSARDYLYDDIVLMHGDLVFSQNVLEKLVNSKNSVAVVSSTSALPEKDFKARIHDNKIVQIGINICDDAIALQPLYHLKFEEWKKWLDKIVHFCENGNKNCYAENAFNEVSGNIELFPMDIRDELCGEIDTEQDLHMMIDKIRNAEKKTVYMCFSTDIIHSGHISIINKARKMGQLIIGVLSDEAVISYKRYPLLSAEERMTIFKNISGVDAVVEQHTLSYKDILESIKPDYVVHGDDWKIGFQAPVREEVLSILAEYGGQLIEFPYSFDQRYELLEASARKELSLPDIRRGRLKQVLETKGLITALEAHSGLTGLLVEKTVVHKDGKGYQFDAMWVSSLCDSTAKGKPDIELVDMTSRFRTIDDIMEVTTKPIIFDGDTGGLAEHFVYTVRTLERMGVSMVIIEDKTGLKKNSLFGTDVVQTQENIEDFCEKIRAGKRAKKTRDFMICARIESLILEKGMDDALKRAIAYTDAGADALMIHSRKKDPEEIVNFVRAYRKIDTITPIVVVPTSFNAITEAELKEIGVNVVIYANQLTRASFPAMRRAAESILLNHRALECDELCMPFKEIISLIPEDI